MRRDCLLQISMAMGLKALMEDQDDITVACVLFATSRGPGIEGLAFADNVFGTGDPLAAEQTVTPSTVFSHPPLVALDMT